MDAIHLTNIRAYGYTGALPEETVLGQWFQADITLYLDLTQATASDRLADTHDYRTVINSTQAIISGQKFVLIERLAGAIATSALESDLRLQRVTVRVTKLTPPIPNYTGQVAVEITRDRIQ
ncbi:dihydroneopterin aldolase [Nodosilinea sp. LEGE 07088]|uniref:dihydroneopterin aldolase n=1 Tax=Nodosilinea sp. LEGE 07088 TaxID=2777968 RepID=UPI0018830CB1|nr:dihydroneopterin aldolase [Nodosilinea sp. LEGE 07088]MBE9137283.1 dihydroneopterin aldolase [Nodosilinea sp. LEGE 07088]